MPLDVTFDTLFSHCSIHLWIVILRVLIVPHTNKLLVFVGRGKNDGCNAEDIFFRDFMWFGRWCGEGERVDPNRHRADHAIIELLVVLLRVRRRNKDQFPF